MNQNKCSVDSELNEIEYYMSLMSGSSKELLETILANADFENYDDNTVSFSSPEGSSFATDNCATHDLCNDRSFFVDDIVPISNVGFRGVGGSATAPAIGPINFSLKSENDDID